MSFNIEVAGGTSVKLPTAGKYCDRDIIITATGGSGGDTSMEDSIVDGTATVYANDRVIKVRDYAFYNCQSLTSVNFPKVDTVGMYAFYKCSNLTAVSFPCLSNLGSRVFESCSSLTTIDLPAVTTIPNSTFYYCTNLTTASFSSCTTINPYAFYGCKNLQNISVPVVKTIGTNAFRYCSSLTAIEFPSVTSMSSYALANCSNLTTVVFPMAQYIPSGAFYYCDKLASLYLLSSSVCTLQDTNAIANGSNIRIYVPTSLVSRYKTTTNWTYFSSAISSYGIGSIDDNSIRINSTKTITVNTNFITTPHDVSVVSQENDVVSISNVSADLHNITFDATAFNIDKEVTIIVSATDGNIVLQESMPLNIYHIIGDLEDNYIELNNSKTISIPLLYDEILPSSVNIVSNDNSVLSVFNVQYDAENITCDIASYDTVKFENIAVTVVYNEITYSKELTINVGQSKYFTVENLDTTYGFVLNDDGYYQSNNKGVPSSFAICKLNIYAAYESTVYLDCINNGQVYADYGILSKLDTKLSLSASADSTNVYKSFISGSQTQTISYNIPAGKHFIYIKYIKDGGGHSNIDAFKFKVRFE